MVWRKDFPHELPVAACVAAVGNFDGVHEGHKALLALARGEADRNGLPLVALTFAPHPRTVLRPDAPLPMLMTLDEKIAALGACGVDGVAVLGFNMTVAGWGPEVFMDKVLRDWLGAVAVCVGENFRFGHKAAGHADDLRKGGFEVRVVPLVRDSGGVVISSTRLREGLA